MRHGIIFADGFNHYGIADTITDFGYASGSIQTYDETDSSGNFYDTRFSDGKYASGSGFVWLGAHRRYCTALATKSTRSTVGLIAVRDVNVPGGERLAVDVSDGYLRVETSRMRYGTRQRSVVWTDTVYERTLRGFWNHIGVEVSEGTPMVDPTGIADSPMDGWLRVFFNGEQIGEVSGLRSGDCATSFEALRTAEIFGFSGQVDDYYVSDGTNGYPGDCRIKTLYPVGPNGRQGFQPTNTIESWQAVNQAQLDSTSVWTQAAGVGTSDLWSVPAHLLEHPDVIALAVTTKATKTGSSKKVFKSLAMRDGVDLAQGNSPPTLDWQGGIAAVWDRTKGQTSIVEADDLTRAIVAQMRFGYTVVK